MPDQQGLEAPELSVQVGSSLASVWARYVGARPADAETQLDGGVVRWIIPNGTSAFAAAISADPIDGEAPTQRTAAGFARETSVAVAKATRRRVVARVSKHDAKTDIVTESFILEALRVKN